MFTSLSHCAAKFRILWIVASVLLLAAIPAFAQLPTGTILGDVKDPSGAIVPNATVTVTNVDTSLARTASTGTDGFYRFSALSVGNYQVKVEKQGFRIAERTGFVLTVGQEAVLNFVLSVGTKEEILEVSAETPVVDATSSSLGNLVGEQTVSDLPLNGRNFIDLTLLLPGVTQLTNEGQISGFMGTTYSSNGAPVRSNNVMIDGTSMVNYHGLNASSVTGTTLGIDGVKEYQVVTSMFKAEYGTAMGSQTNIVTKSGTNKFHGSVFEYFRNSALDARNYFDYFYQLPKTVPGGGRRLPLFQRNQFGGTMGGPIQKDKTFFFVNYEGLRQNLGSPPYVGIDHTIPANCFSAPGQIILTNNPCAVLPPGALPGFPGNLTGTVAPQMVAVANLYPYPNLPSLNDPSGPADRFIWASSEKSTENFGQARIDHTFSAKDSIFGRYTIDNSNSDRPRAFPQFGEAWYSRAQYLTLSETHVFSPSVLNMLRGSFTRTTFLAKNVAAPEVMSATTSPIEGQPPQYAVPAVSPWGAGTTPGELIQNLLTWGDDLYWTKGKHALKFGTLMNHYQMIQDWVVAPGSLAAFPNINFFLNGLTAAIVFQTGKQDRDWNFYTFGFYGQDDYRVTSRLTLNLGLRYELATVPSEANGKSYTFPDLSTGTLTSAVNGPPWQNYTHKNFGPRIGFAWDVFGKGRTAVRGGYGIYYDVAGLGTLLWMQSLGQPPVSLLKVVLFNPLTFPLNRAAEPSIADLSVVDYHSKQPYLQQYNLNVQQQLPLDIALSVAYVGSRGIHLRSTREGNPVRPCNGPLGRLTPGCPASLPDWNNGLNPVWDPTVSVFACPLGTPCRVNPNFGAVAFLTTNADSWYNALQVALTKKFSRGLQFQGSYTWAKVFDTAQGVVTGNTDPSTDVLNPFNPRGDKGITAFDVKHNLRLNLMYQFPNLHSNNFSAKLLNGWKMGNTVSIQSGYPFTPALATGFNNSNSELGLGDIGLNLSNERASFVTAANVGAITSPTCGATGSYNATTGVWCDPNAVVYNPGTVINGTPSQWFNPHMFTIATQGHLGDVPRGTLRGPGLGQWDFSLIKNTPLHMLGENGNLEFRAEFFNVLNRTNFQFPSSGTDAVGNTAAYIAVIPGVLAAPNPHAGEITNTATTSRQIQFALKIQF